MGKPTGFLEYTRRVNPAQSPTARIAHFNEFHPPIDEAARRTQGARCMNCGVPFCQSGMMLGGMATGCPLHNLTPEWNDAVYRGDWTLALERLCKTASFPEFTGRVCPALCEAACTCGMNDDPVTVKENELAIIEHAFAAGLMQPRIPSVRTGRRVAVVGSGPAGLACADRLNRRGHTVTVFEKADRPGGLLMYGIPNMKLEKSVVLRRIALMEAEGVTFVCNTAVGENLPAEQLLQEFDAVVLCCGAGQPRDLAVPGREASGVHFAVDFLTSTTRALLDGTYESGGFLSAKDKHVVIVGGGDTGNDCVGTCLRHGCASVHQLEMMPALPACRQPSNPWPQWPRVCKTDYGQEEAIARFGHDPRIYQTTIRRLLTDDAGALRAIVTVDLAPEHDAKTGRLRMVEVPDSEREMECDLLLIAAGFLGAAPATVEAFGLDRTPRGTVQTAADSHRTAIDAVFCAGDMRRGQSLVVWAIAEGRQAAREVDEYLMGCTNLD